MRVLSNQLQIGDRIIDTRGREYEVREIRPVEKRRIGIQLRQIGNASNEGEIVVSPMQQVERVLNYANTV